MSRAAASAPPRAASAPAVWALLWNNPKLHTPERRKIWLACDEHRQSLGDFLGARGFLEDVVAARGRRGLRERRSAQPPMADIGRSGWRNVGSSMPWPARLPRHRDDPAVGDLLVGGAGAQRARAGRTPRGRTGSCGPGRRR